jgi:hypothetical protein
VFVIGDDRSDCRVGFEQAPGRGRGDDIYRSMLGGQRGEQGRREDDVAQKGGLNDQTP